MYFVYILKSEKDNHRYIGVTKDLKNRFLQHMLGQVKSTKHRRPLKIVGCRAFGTIYEALVWEKKYKNSHGQLERDVKNGKITLLDKI
jgi:putative endonuclease